MRCTTQPLRQLSPQSRQMTSATATLGPLRPQPPSNLRRPPKTSKLSAPLSISSLVNRAKGGVGARFGLSGTGTHHHQNGGLMAAATPARARIAATLASGAAISLSIGLVYMRFNGPLHADGLSGDVMDRRLPLARSGRKGTVSVLHARRSHDIGSLVQTVLDVASVSF